METTVLNSERARLVQSEKMSAAGNLLAGIVHELNNPLTTILGFSELLLQEGHADPSRLAKIHSEAERSVRIIQNVLRLARADNGGTEQIDINDSIRRTVELAAYQLRLNRIDIELNLADESPKVFGRAGELTQVVLNLLTNAIQAISSALPSGRVRVSTAVIHHRVLITIADNGPGISEGNIERIFEPFFTTKETGTGFGLSLSREIVNKMGGDMWAAGNEFGGATFTIDLPGDRRKVADPARPSPAALQRPLPEGDAISVLVVDDEDHITELIESVLADTHNTHAMTRGELAIEALKNRDFDVLICDLHMPGVSGYDLVEWTRKNRPNIRILLLSGDVARQETGDFAKACSAQFLSKPFTVSELKNAVQRLFS